MDWLKRVDDQDHVGVDQARGRCEGTCGSTCQSSSGEAAHDCHGDAEIDADRHDLPLAGVAGEDAGDEDDGFAGSPVFTLATILDPSTDALTAARRMYAACPTGLRFFSEDRRVERTRLGAQPPMRMYDEIEPDAEPDGDAAEDISDEFADTTAHDEY